METVTANAKTAKPKRGKPFTKGDPRIQAGPGRPPRSEAERERWLQARKARERVVTDLAAELLRVSGRAVDTLVALLDDPDPAIRLRASSTIADRLWGTAISRSEIMATIGHGEVRRVTPEELAAAARTFLLRQGAAQAEPVEVVE